MSYGVFGSSVTFLASEDGSIERRAASATLERRMSDTWTLALSGGVGLPGHILLGGERHAIRPGWLGAVSSSWRLLEEKGRLPFVLLSLTMAASGATTRYAGGGSPGGYAYASGAVESLLAFDARVGILAGKTFWDVLHPYAGVRAFGGPIFWSFRGEDVIGGDKYHFQIALGTSVSLPAGLDVFAEIAPLGERAVNLGAGTSF